MPRSRLIGKGSQRYAWFRRRNTDRLFGLDDAALTLLREARLGATLDRIFAARPYRRTFVAAGIRGRSDIATLSDIARLPVTTKADYMADAEASDSARRAHWTTKKSSFGT